MDLKPTLTATLVIVSLIFSHLVLAGDAERRQAKRIHDRLTGVNATNAAIDDMEATLDCTLPPTPGYPCDGTGKNAAKYAIDTLQHNPDAANPNAHYFYNVTLKNFAAPWTNEEQTVFTELNDYSATIVGAVRDGLDFRRILYDDLLYIGPASGVPAYSNSNNNHYAQLETLGPAAGDLSSTSVLRGPNQGITQSAITGLPSPATAGIMTSRAASMAFFSDGTNRAMFRFTLMNHLCTDLEPLKDVSRTPDRVRRDVSRSPGGDSRIFLNNCVGCHAGMDGMAGAFAFYEWSYTNDKTDGNLVYTPGTVSNKHNINPDNFEHGYVTVDDSWVNYWRNGQNWLLGWGPAANPDSKGNEHGNGAKALGIELANSTAFAQCQVDKVFEAVCLRDPNVRSADRAQRDTIRDAFRGAYGYNLREVFTDVAAYCKGS